MLKKWHQLKNIDFDSFIVFVGGFIFVVLVLIFCYCNYLLVRVNTKFNQQKAEISQIDQENQELTKKIERYSYLKDLYEKKQQHEMSKQIVETDKWKKVLKGFTTQKIYINGWIPEYLKTILTNNNFTIVSDNLERSSGISNDILGVNFIMRKENGEGKILESDFSSNKSPCLRINVLHCSSNVFNEFDGSDVFDFDLARGNPENDPEIGSLEAGIIKINKYIHR